VFRSISGELGLFYPGSPTIFVRFAGCPLSCTWCDTSVAIPRDSGQEMSVEEVLQKVEMLSLDKQIDQVLITGGEPLWQRTSFETLVRELKIRGYKIQVETSGVCFPSSAMLPEVDWWVVDYKLPSSGEEKKMRLEEFWKFGVRSSIKFACQDRMDLYSIEKLADADSLFQARQILLSPVAPLTVRELLEWQERAGLTRPWLQKALLNVQLHKLVGLIEDQK
jgi:7-carboxy-7-deazaguanine synthase